MGCENKMQTTDQLLTEREAAALLRLSLSMLRKMRANRTGPSWLKISACVRYPSTAVAEFVQARLVSK